VDTLPLQNVSTYEEKLFEFTDLTIFEVLKPYFESLEFLEDFDVSDNPLELAVDFYESFADFERKDFPWEVFQELNLKEHFTKTTMEHPYFSHMHNIAVSPFIDKDILL